MSDLMKWLRILVDPGEKLQEEWQAANSPEGCTGRAVLKVLLWLTIVVAIVVVFAVFGIDTGDDWDVPGVDNQ